MTGTMVLFLPRSSNLAFRTSFVWFLPESNNDKYLVIGLALGERLEPSPLLRYLSKISDVSMSLTFR